MTYGCAVRVQVNGTMWSVSQRYASRRTKEYSYP
jgi:hypothetical protein